MSKGSTQVANRIRTGASAPGPPDATNGLSVRVARRRAGATGGLPASVIRDDNARTASFSPPAIVQSLHPRQLDSYGKIALILVILLVICGCHGSGTVSIVPAATAKISTTAPLIEEFRPTECYYWVTDDHELRIAMRQLRRSVWKLKREEFILSLVLRGLPAGAGRDYRASRQTMRAQRWKGYGHARLASFGGIVAIWDYGKREIRGRFRLPAKRQVYSFLTGWGGDQPLLVVGDFTAIPDQTKGEAILARTEKRGMERGPEPRRARRIQGPPRKSK